MKYKNYYKILGLPNAKVTDSEIKSAYRHFAKLYHPDLNAGDERIAEKFKDVNEAYQILGNENSRKKYDRVYFAYRFRDGISNSESKINTAGANDFFTMFFGAKKDDIMTNTKSTKNVPIKGENLESELDISLEEAFYGTERKIAFKTVENKIKTLSVKVPAGIKTGEKIRLKNQGKPSKNGGENGDFYITINILPHERFTINGSDLVMNLELTPWEAALGCELNIAGIDSNIYLNVPAGAQTDDKFRVTGSGYVNETGNRGDLLLVVKIMIPKSLSDKEKELFLKFKEFSSFNPRHN